MQEFVFPKQQMRDLLESATDSEFIAIQIDYQPAETGGFKAVITATGRPLLSPDGSLATQTNGTGGSKSNGNGSKTAGGSEPAAATESFRAATMQVSKIEGCPNPPGCAGSTNL